MVTQNPSSTTPAPAPTRTILFSHPITHLTYQMRFTLPNAETNNVTLSIHSFLSKKTYENNAISIPDLSPSQAFELFNYFANKWRPNASRDFGGSDSSDSDALMGIVEEDQQVQSDDITEPQQSRSVMLITIKYAALFQNINTTLTLNQVRNEAQERIDEYEGSAIGMLMQRLDRLENENNFMRFRIGRMERIRDDILSSYGRVMYNPRYDLIADKHRQLAVGWEDYERHNVQYQNGAMPPQPQPQQPVFSPLPPFSRLGLPELIRQHYSQYNQPYPGGVPMSPPQRRPSVTSNEPVSAGVTQPGTPFASQRERFSNSPGMGRNMRSKTPPPPPRQPELYEHLSDVHQVDIAPQVPYPAAPPMQEVHSISPVPPRVLSSPPQEQRRMPSPPRRVTNGNSRARSQTPPRPSSSRGRRRSPSPPQRDNTRHESPVRNAPIRIEAPPSRNQRKVSVSPPARRSGRPSYNRSPSPPRAATRQRSPSPPARSTSRGTTQPDGGPVRRGQRVESRSPSPPLNNSRKRARSPSTVSAYEPSQKRTTYQMDAKSNAKEEDFANLDREQRLLRSLLFEFGPLTAEQLLDYFHRFASADDLVSELLGPGKQPRSQDFSIVFSPITTVSLSNLIMPFKHLFELDLYYEPPAGLKPREKSISSDDSPPRGRRGDRRERPTEMTSRDRASPVVRPAPSPPLQDRFRRERSTLQKSPSRSFNQNSSRTVSRAPEFVADNSRNRAQSQPRERKFTGPPAPPSRDRRERKVSTSPPPRQRRR